MLGAKVPGAGPNDLTKQLLTPLAPGLLPRLRNSLCKHIGKLD